MKKVFYLLLTLAFILNLVFLYTIIEKKRLKKQYFARDMVKHGDKAPEFQIEDINGNILRSNDFKNKIILLQFVSMNVLLSESMLNHLNGLYNRFRENNRLAIVIITHGNNMLRYYQEKYSVYFPIVVDNQLNLYKLFGISRCANATTIVINKEKIDIASARIFDQKEVEQLVKSRLNLF